jgi:hypothetical protein
MVISLLTDSEIIVSKISSRAEWSWGVALENKEISSLATSSDLLLRYKYMKFVSTSSLIFFSLEKMRILISGRDSLAF